jgi:TolB-like protein/Tfp pilus assembly protein PilF
MSFVSELRRRQVFRTAAWYGGLAWLAVEIANTVFPQFGLPDWSVRAVIVAVVLGLPIAVILAWSFDLTATGARREDSAAAAAANDTRPVPATPFWRIPSLWLSLALGAGLALSVQQAWRHLVRPDLDERPALAVLPFANLSPDPENAYFADGLHEEVLATLARAGGLRVISRTSVQEFRDSKRNLKEIADALGVSLILEGSVRRDGDDLRLTLQLIDGRTDEHLWAETYDRKFRESLDLQQSIAGQVVAAIGATLSPAEQRLIGRATPTVPEAYDAYLHALALASQYATEAEFGVVLALLDRSIGLDPTFAPAYALRAKTRIWFHAVFGLDEQTQTDAASSDIKRALQLEPGLPDALVARGLFHTYVAQDPERALEDLSRALELAPSDADTHNVAGLTLRRLGRFDEAIAHFTEAARLAPGDERYDFRVAQTLTWLGRIDEAERERQRLVERYPADPLPRLYAFAIRFLATGRIDGFREEFERVAAMIEEPARTEAAVYMLTMVGDLPGLAATLESATAQGRDRARLDLATTYLALGDEARARPILEATVVEAIRLPDDAFAVAEGAVALELLGRTDEALRSADRAVQLAPERLDAVNAPQVAMLRAWVLIHSGARADEGYREFERLIGSINLQPRWVAATPLWRLLRDDQRVQQILESKFPRT